MYPIIRKDIGLYTALQFAIQLKIMAIMMLGIMVKRGIQIILFTTVCLRFLAPLNTLAVRCRIGRKFWGMTGVYAGCP